MGPKRGPFVGPTTSGPKCRTRTVQQARLSQMSFRTSQRWHGTRFLLCFISIFWLKGSFWKIRVEIPFFDKPLSTIDHCSSLYIYINIYIFIGPVPFLLSPLFGHLNLHSSRTISPFSQVKEEPCGLEGPLPPLQAQCRALRTALISVDPWSPSMELQAPSLRRCSGANVLFTL